MWRSPIRPSQGFTLIEMLLAIALFAVLALTAYMILDQVRNVRGATTEARQELAQLQRVMVIMERDFAQMLPRTSRVEDESLPEQLFDAGEGRFDSDGEGIRFYRLGWLNPQGRLPRGTIQQVAYRIKGQTLQRLHTLYPDPVVDQEPVVADVLEGVSGLAFSFFLNGEWQTLVDGLTFPEAIAVEFELEGLGAIQRKFLLPDGPEEESASGSGGPAGGVGGDDDDDGGVGDAGG